MRDDEYTLSDAMRDLAPHLIRREAKSSTRLDDCTQNEEEPMSDAYTDCFERDSDRDRRSNNQYSQWTGPLYQQIESLRAELAQALAEKDRLQAQLAGAVKALRGLGKYMNHLSDCRMRPVTETSPACTCGLAMRWQSFLTNLPAEAERTLAIVKAVDEMMQRHHRDKECQCRYCNSFRAAMGTAVSGEEKR